MGTTAVTMIQVRINRNAGQVITAVLWVGKGMLACGGGSSKLSRSMRACFRCCFRCLLLTPTETG